MASEVTPSSSKDGHGPTSLASPGGYRTARFVDSAGSEVPLATLSGREDTRARLGQNRLPRGEATPAWNSMEEEAAQRWNRALQLSPKATSENLTSRRTRDAEVRRDMELLEEKLMRQVLRLQEQSERFMDIMMHPLEAKVAAMEGRQPVTDCSIAELRGNLRGLQESLEMQVRRSEQTETRLCKWRKSVEDDLHQKQEETNRKFSEAITNSDVVSRGELLELAKVLKQELRKVVDETLRDEKLATQQDLATVSTSLRKELSSVEKIAAGAAAQKSLGQQELAHAAEAVRAEMKTLTERAVAEEALTLEKFAAIDALQKASQDSQNALVDLATRLSQCERNQQELRLAHEEHRGLGSAEALESNQALEELVGRVMKCEAMMEDLDQGRSPQRFQASEALEESHLSRRMSRLEQEQLQKGQKLASSIEALEVTLREGLAKTERIAQAALAARPSGEGPPLANGEVDEDSTGSWKAVEVALSERLLQVETAVQALPGRLTKCEHRGEELEREVESLRQVTADLQASGTQVQVLTEGLAQCEQLSEASHLQVQALAERLAKCEQFSEAAGQLQLLSDRVAHCEELSEASKEQGQVLSERVAQCEQQSQAVEALAARLEKCEKQTADGEPLARPPMAAVAAHPNLPGQAFAEESVRALDGVTSRLDSLETQQRASEAGLANAKRLNEEMESSILKRLEALEIDPMKKADADPADEKELSDTQLMLLDLQRRVSLLEHGYPRPGGELEENAEDGEVVEPTPRTATLSQAAELIEQMELDLKRARQAAGLDSVSLQRVNSKEGTPRSLPPLAAMKVLSSPRLLQLSMTPRLTSSSAQQDAAAICTASSGVMSAYTREDKADSSSLELRAEIAAVWDAVAELAEIVGDAAPPGAVRLASNSGSGAIQNMASAAVAGVHNCESRIESLSSQLLELASRLTSLERQQSVPEAVRDETIATFDATGDNMFHPTA